nr:transposase, MuDR, MULE transposase domain protein [Tanacetum cinerariifolium]
MFSIIYESVHGILYKDSKKEKKVMRHLEIHKFYDATLNRVLEGLKSYNNDVSCQRDPEAPALSLTNQDLLYLKKGNSGPEKIVLSLHKFPTVVFNDDDIEEITSRWVNKDTVSRNILTFCILSPFVIVIVIMATPHHAALTTIAIYIPHPRSTAEPSQHHHHLHHISNLSPTTPHHSHPPLCTITTIPNIKRPPPPRQYHLHRNHTTTTAATTTQKEQFFIELDSDENFQVMLNMYEKENEVTIYVTTNKEIVTSERQKRSKLRFSNAIDFKKSLNHYALMNEFEYFIEKSKPNRFTTRCAQLTCRWRIHAAILQDGVTFKVKKLSESHSYIRSNKGCNKCANQGWIASVIKEKLKSDGDVSVTKLKKWLMQHYDVEVPYLRVFRGKEKAYTDMYGKWEDSFIMINAFKEEIRNKIPGSVVDTDFEISSNKKCF